jgi:hypothetical protein
MFLPLAFCPCKFAEYVSCSQRPAIMNTPHEAAPILALKQLPRQRVRIPLAHHAICKAFNSSLNSALRPRVCATPRCIPTMLARYDNLQPAQDIILNFRQAAFGNMFRGGHMFASNNKCHEWQVKIIQNQCGFAVVSVLVTPEHHIEEVPLVPPPLSRSPEPRRLSRSSSR